MNQQRGTGGDLKRGALERVAPGLLLALASILAACEDGARPEEFPSSSINPITPLPAAGPQPGAPLPPQGSVGNAPASADTDDNAVAAGRALPGDPVLDSRGMGDEYQAPGTNPFVMVDHDPLSTFAVDVDTASYDVFRRDVARLGAQVHARRSARPRGGSSI